MPPGSAGIGSRARDWRGQGSCDLPARDGPADSHRQWVLPGQSTSPVPWRASAGTRPRKAALARAVSATAQMRPPESSTRSDALDESALEVAALERLCIVDDHGEVGMCPSKVDRTSVVRVRQQVNAWPGGQGLQRRAAAGNDSDRRGRARGSCLPEHLQHVGAARPRCGQREEAGRPGTVRSTQMGVAGVAAHAQAHASAGAASGGEVWPSSAGGPAMRVPEGRERTAGGTMRHGRRSLQEHWSSAAHRRRGRCTAATCSREDGPEPIVAMWRARCRR